MFELIILEGFVCGIDEVGWGLFVGLVVVVVVIFDLVRLIFGLNDLKKFSEKKCVVLVVLICEWVVVWVVVEVMVEEIDWLNILQVMFFVMQWVVVGLVVCLIGVMVDGNCCLKLDILSEVVVQGDGKIVLIVVVFILVKMVCDVGMLDLYVLYLNYGFDCYMGYLMVVYFVVLEVFGVLLVYWCSFVLVVKQFMLL